MAYPIILQNLVNYLVAEMSTIICDQCSRGSKDENMWLHRNWATTLASLVWVGIASTHFET